MTTVDESQVDVVVDVDVGAANRQPSETGSDLHDDASTDVAEEESTCRRIRKRLAQQKSTFILIFVPIALLPLILYINGLEAKTAYIIILMAFYWNFEVAPFGVVSLMPVILVPLFGIMSSRQICPSYFTDSNMLFLGGLIMAVSIETWNLHKRIALKTLLLCGLQPRWLLLGFLLPSAALSMWISNTATVAMMLPISDAILKELRKLYTLRSPPGAISLGSADTAVTVTTTNDGEAAKTSTENDQALDADSPKIEAGDIDGDLLEEEEPMKEFLKHKENAEFACICRMLLISTAYGAVFGGVITLTGTSPNVVLNGIVQQYYGSGTGLSFASWMLYAAPLGIIGLLLCWVWLQICFLGFRGLVQRRHGSVSNEDAARTTAVLLREYKKMGPITYAEVNVILVFALTIGLWISREPGSGGWTVLFRSAGGASGAKGSALMSDAQPAILAVMLLFLLPSRNPIASVKRCFGHKGSQAEEEQKHGHKQDGKPSRMLSWENVQQRVSWHVVLVVGAGFALADASKASGLSDWVGQQMTVLKLVPMEAMVFLVCWFSALLTELTSNSTAATILLPILSSLSERLHRHPFYFMLSCTAACSFGFILPISTHANILIFSKGYLRSIDMVKAGSMMFLLSNSVVAAATLTYAPAIFNLKEFPDWAMKNSTVGAGTV